MPYETYCPDCHEKVFFDKGWWDHQNCECPDKTWSGKRLDHQKLNTVIELLKEQIELLEKIYFELIAL